MIARQQPVNNTLCSRHSAVASCEDNNCILRLQVSHRQGTKARVVAPVPDCAIVSGLLDAPAQPQRTPGRLEALRGHVEPGEVDPGR